MHNQGYGVDSSMMTMKMKRKDFDLDDVSDEFSDFSLSTPASKIRRLDAELAPIIEEEEPDIPVIFEQLQPEVGLGSNAKRGVVIEELPSGLENEERAIVLFNPINTPIVHSPSNFSISVSPKFISGFKNGVLWSKQSNQWGASASEDSKQDKNSAVGNECLAVVPWVPSQLPLTTGNAALNHMDATDPMEAEETELSTMDVEDDAGGFNHATEMNTQQGLNQWQQQHCLIPQPPQNTSHPLYGSNDWVSPAGGCVTITNSTL